MGQPACLLLFTGPVRPKREAGAHAIGARFALEMAADEASITSCPQTPAYLACHSMAASRAPAQQQTASKRSTKPASPASTLASPTFGGEQGSSKAPKQQASSSRPEAHSGRQGRQQASKQQVASSSRQTRPAPDAPPSPYEVRKTNIGARGQHAWRYTVNYDHYYNCYCYYYYY